MKLFRTGISSRDRARDHPDTVQLDIHGKAISVPSVLVLLLGLSPSVSACQLQVRAARSIQRPAGLGSGLPAAFKLRAVEPTGCLAKIVVGRAGDSSAQRSDGCRSVLGRVLLCSGLACWWVNRAARRRTKAGQQEIERHYHGVSRISTTRYTMLRY
jgi:hypothetical protein